MHDIIRRVATVIAQQSTMMDGTGVGMVSSKFHELDEEGWFEVAIEDDIRDQKMY